MRRGTSIIWKILKINMSLKPRKDYPLRIYFILKTLFLEENQRSYKMFSYLFVNNSQFMQICWSFLGQFLFQFFLYVNCITTTSKVYFVWRILIAFLKVKANMDGLLCGTVVCFGGKVTISTSQDNTSTEVHTCMKFKVEKGVS